VFIVRQQGKTIESFTFFVDAWLFVYLECECFALILASDGDTWTINPAYNASKSPIN
jgi:hypothetical protein